jgi:DNA polymerase III subunit chi
LAHHGGQSAPNAARHLFLIGGAQSTHLDDFDRGFDLFDGQDEASVQAARGRFRQAREAGHVLTYWQQSEVGRWEKRQ